MQQAIIGSKNQIVIPKEIRERVIGMRPGRKIIVYPLDQNTVALKVSQNSWLESSYGAMAKTWKNLNVIKQLEKMRNEW